MKCWGWSAADVCWEGHNFCARKKYVNLAYVIYFYGILNAFICVVEHNCCETASASVGADAMPHLIKADCKIGSPHQLYILNISACNTFLWDFLFLFVLERNCSMTKNFRDYHFITLILLLWTTSSAHFTSNLLMLHTFLEGLCFFVCVPSCINAVKQSVINILLLRFNCLLVKIYALSPQSVRTSQSECLRLNVVFTNCKI